MDVWACLDPLGVLKVVKANMVHVEGNGKPALILQRSSGQVVTPAKILQFMLGSDDRMGKTLYVGS